mmetsp:Transcript_11425/g.17567  ORF Transcript_11425/g.17567 Transcript_11425/m.17567 type:complete len:830 (+) Transcript_11425:211-2700(+)|eukprot:CAMPEP_0178903276 /NCGR_PEP_ID=MMETSP0786-20121207/5070_1 /TAXON_ID=186022 /ORGANISM="Thalassionema frauenfeldii, Strain CCMP 1798" /LENGTH=829 /DNA_ID=CAMNT_0020574635 /DNA_START=148 /DNA_END=2637 /DNA_ORIENTATION=+
MSTARRRAPRYSGYGDLPATSLPLSEKDRSSDDAASGEKSNSRRALPIKKDDDNFESHNKGHPVSSDKKDCRYYTSRIRVIVTLIAINALVIWLYRSYKQDQDELRLVEAVVKQNFFKGKSFPRVLDDGYVVFVTASNGKASPRGTYTRMGRSKESVLDAMNQATRQFPLTLLMNRQLKQHNSSSHSFDLKTGFIWFQVDVVTGIKRFEDFDTASKIDPDGDAWFGLALGWDDFAVLPNQVQANCMVDIDGFIRWERVLQFLQRNHDYSNRLSGPSTFKGAGGRGWQQWREKVQAVLPDYSDDATRLDVVDLFKTESVFIDLSHYEYHHIYHSTILPHPVLLTSGGHRVYEYPTNSVMTQAVWKAALYSAQAVDTSEGFMVSYYHPRSHFYDFTSSSTEFWEDHATSLFELARLHTHLKLSPATTYQNGNIDDNQKAKEQSDLAHNILMALKHGLSYLTKQLKGCYLPFTDLFERTHADGEFQCLLTVSGNHRSAKLSDNAMLLAALAEYMDTTKGDTTYLYWTMELAEYVQGSFVGKNGDPQHQNIWPNSFVHKVQQPLYVKRGIPVTYNPVDDFSDAQAAFALSRLVQVADKYSIKVPKRMNDQKNNEGKTTETPRIVQWNQIAYKSVEQAILNNKWNPWLTQTIAQLNLTFKQKQSLFPPVNANMVQYAVQAIHTTANRQIQNRNDANRGALEDEAHSIVPLATLINRLCPLHSLLSTGISHKGPDNSLRTYINLMVLGILYLLPHQIQPEASMFMPHDATRAIGGWRSTSLSSKQEPSLVDISTRHTMIAANAVACVQDMLQNESKSTIQQVYQKLFGNSAHFHL